MQTDSRIPSGRLPKKKTAKVAAGRPDPAPRPMDGVEPVAMLDPASMDPAMEYKWASSAYAWFSCSVEDYQQKGWAVQTHQPGGVRPLIMGFRENPEPGTPIERPGLVLMGKPKAAARAEWEAGQRETDRTENFIRGGSQFGAVPKKVAHVMRMNTQGDDGVGTLERGADSLTEYAED